MQFVFRAKSFDNLQLIIVPCREKIPYDNVLVHSYMYTELNMQIQDNKLLEASIQTKEKHVLYIIPGSQEPSHAMIGG